MKTKKISLAEELAKKNPKPVQNSLAEVFAKRNLKPAHSSLAKVLAKENSQFSNTSSDNLSAFFQKRQNSKSV